VLGTVLRRVGAFLYRAGLAPLVYRVMPRTPRVVAYHACDPVPSDYTEGLGVNTTPEVFAQHLAFYQSHYSIIDPAILENPGPHPPRALAITFDDGYRSVHEHAFPLLRREGLPAAVYLVTGVLESAGLIWVNELNWWLRRRPAIARRCVAEAFDLSAPDPPETLLEGVRARFDAERMARLLGAIHAAADQEAISECAAAKLYLDWTQIAEMHAAGIRFGCHTITHPSLPRLDSLTREREVSGSRRAVEGRLGECRSFAYPFGDVDVATREAAVRAGFATLMEVGGLNWPWKPTAIARIPVQSMTAAELFAELEVVAPVKGLLRRLLHRLRARTLNARG